MEEASELSYYRPLSLKTESEQKYIEFLWDAFESNEPYSTDSAACSWPVRPPPKLPEQPDARRRGLAQVGGSVSLPA